MNARELRREAMRIGGETRRTATASSRSSTPTPSSCIGTVPKATVDDVRRAFAIAKAYRPQADALRARGDPAQGGGDRARAAPSELSDLITAESGPVQEGLALRDRPRQRRAAASAPTRRCKDDGQIFSCDLTPHGKKRRVYTQRDPLLGVISAITPFNHPMNQVAHKVVPSIATNNRMVLKPSEKVPLSAIVLADILYEAGLPPRDATRWSPATRARSPTS